MSIRTCKWMVILKYLVEILKINSYFFNYSQQGVEVRILLRSAGAFCHIGIRFVHSLGIALQCQPYSTDRQPFDLSERVDFR